MNIKKTNTCKSRSAVSRCINCNRMINGNDTTAIRITIPAQRGGVTVCADCAKPRKAGTFTPAFYDGGNQRKETELGRVAIALQCDCKPVSPATFPAYALATMGTYVSVLSDGTYRTFPRVLKNQHGTRATLATLENVSKVARCNVQLACYDANCNTFIPRIPDAVIMALRNVSGIERCNVKNDVLDVQILYTELNATTWIIYLLQDVLKLARDSKTTALMLKHIYAHCNGRAVWQRPERNSNA